MKPSKRPARKQAPIHSQITIGGIPIHVIQKDIKNMHLSVRPPDGQVRITAPYSASGQAIRRFVLSKLDWIQKHRRTFQAQPHRPPPAYLSGETHYYQGRPYTLNIIERPGRTKITLSGSRLNLAIAPGSSRAQRQKALTEWYRRQLKQHIPPLIKKWETIIGEPVSEWGVKQMKTRWGTCNINARRIWINLELAKKPVHCLEYIIVHEIVHLLERLHNKRFVAYMNQFLPEWRQYKHDLNNSPSGRPELEH